MIFFWFFKVFNQFLAIFMGDILEICPFFVVYGYIFSDKFLNLCLFDKNIIAKTYKNHLLAIKILIQACEAHFWGEARWHLAIKYARASLEKNFLFKLSEIIRGNFFIYVAKTYDQHFKMLRRVCELVRKNYFA